MIGGLIAGILVIIILLALTGLGWDTVVSGVKKSADKVGITRIVQLDQHKMISWLQTKIPIPKQWFQFQFVFANYLTLNIIYFSLFIILK
jgi:hypothetical protein